MVENCSEVFGEYWGMLDWSYGLFLLRVLTLTLCSYRGRDPVQPARAQIWTLTYTFISQSYFATYSYNYTHHLIHTLLMLTLSGALLDPGTEVTEDKSS